MTTTPQKTALLIIFLTVFIDLLGFGIVLPLLPIYTGDIARYHGFDKSQVGWIVAGLMTSFSIMQFLFAPLWGRLSDRVGRRPVLLLSLSGSMSFYFLFGLAMQWRSLAWLLVSRIGAGIAAATIPTAQAYIADVTPPDKRARGMALIGAAFGLGFTFGPLLGALACGLGKGMNTLAWPGYVAAVLSAGALSLAIFKLPESLPSGALPEQRKHLDFASLYEAIRIPSIPLLLVTAFCGVFALANLESTISLTIKSLLPAASTASPPRGAGTEEGPQFMFFLVFAYIGLVQSLVQGILVRWLARRVSDTALALVGGALAIAGFVFLAVASDSVHGGVGWLMAAVAVEVSGLGFLLPALQSLISRRSDPAQQGGILGVGESVGTLARIFGMGCGVLLFYQHPTAPFWVAALLMSVAVVVVMIAVQRGKDWQRDSAPSAIANPLG